MTVPLIASAPATGILDDSNNLTLSWTPIANVDGYADYLNWIITVDDLLPGQQMFTVTPPPAYAGGTLTFTQTLSSGSHTLTMYANQSGPNPLTNPWQTVVSGSPIALARVFPDVLTSSQVTLSLMSVLLGQTFTATLSTTYTGADQWRILWPDNTSTPWLPLSSNVVSKSFLIPGAQNIVVQTRYAYNSSQYLPPAPLIRQTSVQIFVIDQQSPTTTTQQGGLTGDLGIGGQQGFEITSASASAATTNPWEIIARTFVRDTVSNELKLLVATTRFSNASTLLGTMAIDVFPVLGRPHSVELIVPPYILTTTANTESSLVKITTLALPSLVVGKPVTQETISPMAAKSGITPYLWTATGLPMGVTLNGSGSFNGTPLELGTFNVTFAVQDSSTPFSIDEVTLPLMVATDLAVQISTGQVDANNAPLAPLGVTLGAAQVNKPYKVAMVVGNINSSSTTPGGLPPYQWSIPAGALPIGLSIDPNTGIISGLPCTYNSTTDYNSVSGKVYTAVVQVVDAIGAKATQTYSMTLQAAPLQFGPIDQSLIFSAQDFKLAVPVFGGLSPYSSLVFSAVDTGTYTSTQPPSSPVPFTPVLIDGQVEIIADVPTTGVGNHSFNLGISDQHTSIGPVQITYRVANEISDVRAIPAFFGVPAGGYPTWHEWAAADTSATGIILSGDLSGYTLAGTTLSLTSVDNASAGSTIYNGNIGNASYAGTTFTVYGFTNPANNGVFLCTATALGTQLTLSNPAGVAEVHGAAAVADLSPGPANGFAIAIDPTVLPTGAIFVNGPPTPLSVSNSQYRIPLTLNQSSTSVATISREYTLQWHDDSASPGDIGIINTVAHPYIVGDAVGFNPRKPYFNSTSTIPASLSGASYTARVQARSSLPPGLSLDMNTGLIYGTLYGTASGPSTIEYIDAGGVVYGTANITWTTYSSNFQISPVYPNSGTYDGQVGLPIVSPNNIIFTGPVGVTLSNPTALYPQSSNRPSPLPFGVTLSVDNSAVNVSGGRIILTGTPTEAGYFDVWIRVTGSGTQSAYAYRRLSMDYTKPMVILNSSLPNIGTIALQPSTTYLNYDGSTVTLQGYGGIPPYTWTSPQFGGVGGAGTGNFAGLTLNLTTGTLTGSLTTIPGTSPTDLGNITFVLTDTRGPSASVTKVLDLTYNNILRIITPAPNGVPLITNDPNGYSFQMLAAGGVPPYLWNMTLPGTPSANLPTGILFASENTFVGGTGAFSGIWPGTPVYTASTFNITVQDNVSSTASGSFYIQTGVATLTVTNGAGTVNRGVPYQGTLTIGGNYTTPVSWSVAPTVAYPNTILPGLSLSADNSTAGVNAVIGGTYSGTPHQVGNIVKIVGNGVSAVATLAQSHGFVVSQSVTIAGTVNFNGTSAISATGEPTDPTFTFPSAYNGTEIPVGATATVTDNLYDIRVVAVDALGQVAGALIPLNTGTDLTVTTSSLTNAVVGGSYNVTLTASGGVPTYTWEVDPISTDTLSGTGLSLSGAGVITGSALGLFTKNLTFRVTDSLGTTPNIARATFTLVSQASGLTIGPQPPAAISGRSYTYQMTASGDANTPYTWTISGSNALPGGISMSSTGLITGISNLTGFSSPITYRVTDSIGAYTEATYTFTVVSGLVLKTGIDFTDSISTGILGYIANGQISSINPRPNRSFYVVATGVVSTSTSTLSVSVGNANVSASIESIDTVNGYAYIPLTGTAFANGELGSNSLTISVIDAGVSQTNTFTWVVYDDGVMRIGATLPTELTTPQ